MIKLSEYVNEHFVNGTNKTQIKRIIRQILSTNKRSDR